MDAYNTLGSTAHTNRRSLQKRASWKLVVFQSTLCVTAERCGWNKTIQKEEREKPRTRRVREVKLGCKSSSNLHCESGICFPCLHVLAAVPCCIIATHELKVEGEGELCPPRPFAQNLRLLLLLPTGLGLYFGLGRFLSSDLALQL